MRVFMASRGFDYAILELNQHTLYELHFLTFELFKEWTLDIMQRRQACWGAAFDLPFVLLPNVQYKTIKAFIPQLLSSSFQKELAPVKNYKLTCDCVADDEIKYPPEINAHFTKVRLLDRFCSLPKGKNETSLIVDSINGKSFMFIFQCTKIF